MGMTIDEHITQLIRVKHYAAPRHYETLDMAIETMRKYQQLQADYENRLKADMVAMLIELQNKINAIPINPDNSEAFRLGQATAYDKSEDVIQQKINNLRGNADG